MAWASVPGIFFLMSCMVCKHQILLGQQHVKTGILLSKHQQSRQHIADRAETVADQYRVSPTPDDQAPAPPRLRSFKRERIISTVVRVSSTLA